MAESKSKSSKAKTQAKRATTEAKKSAAKTAKASKRSAAKTAVAEKNQVQTAVETAVDFPVGAVLAVGDRVSELVEPWTDRSKAERQIKNYRSSLRKSLKRTERRGSTARRKAIIEARKTRNQVEREARNRRREVETSIKRNRTEVEQRVRKAIDEQTSRAQGVVGSAQDLVGSVSDQLASLR
jgi:F0F1-type ATP synthase membrane subunit b/b'